MPTRNVVITNHQAQVIEDLVASGRYQNASEVLRDGLRLVEQREATDAAKLRMLREAVRVGVEQLERGEYTEFADEDEFRRYMEALTDEVIGSVK